MSRISAHDVGVAFPIYEASGRSFKKALLRTTVGGLMTTDGSHTVMVRALDGITFELREGDRLGLLGPNGSGKSTLLRVLAGAYEPVKGSIEIEGRVASMLNVWL